MMCAGAMRSREAASAAHWNIGTRFIGTRIRLGFGRAEVFRKVFQCSAWLSGAEVPGEGPPLDRGARAVALLTR